MQISPIIAPAIVRPEPNRNGGIVPPWLEHPSVPNPDTPVILPVPGPKS